MPSWLSWEEQEVRGSEIYPDFTAVSAVAVPHPFLPLLMILWPRSESVLNHQVSPLSTAALPSLANTSRLTVLKQQPEWCQKLKLDRVTHPLNTAVVPNHRAKVKVCSIACKVLYYFSPWCDPLPPLPENSSLKEEGLTSAFSSGETFHCGRNGQQLVTSMTTVKTERRTLILNSRYFYIQPAIPVQGKLLQTFSMGLPPQLTP